MTTEVTVVIPKRLWLTSNRHGIHRGHRAAIVRELHDEMLKAAYRAGLAKHGSGPVAAHWTIRYPKGVSWLHGDASNAQPTTKACLDALVPHWLDEDGPLIVTAETFTRGPNLDRASDHEITLALTAV